METELKTIIEVSALVVASMAYSRFISTNLNPGKPRLFALLPILCLLTRLPFFFTSINLRGISAFFFAWLALFKLILLSFNLGPLSPTLPLLPFIVTASLPVNLRPPNKPPPPPLNTFLLISLFITFLSLYHYRHKTHPYLIAALYYVYMQLTLELLLSTTAAVLSLLLGLDLEAQFDGPLRASSIQDFWVRRWNLMYVPEVSGVMTRFIVSGAMHELMIYYLVGVKPTGEVAVFFVLHGVCMVVETRAKERGWWPRATVAVPIGFCFFGVSLSWFFFPPILRSGAGERAMGEVGEMMRSVEVSGRVLVDRVWLLWN